MQEDNVKDVEVSVPEVQKGSIQFMNKSGFNNPPPEKLKRILAALKYFCVSLITMVSATDLFSGGQAKVINFSLGVAILVMGGIELATGVRPVEDK
jgi:hypothetical protein